MYIKQKLHTILNRVKYAFVNEVKEQNSTEYAKGFKHAYTLVEIAVSKEFDYYLQIDTNKSLEIADLKKEISKLCTSIDNQKRYILHLEEEASKRQMSKLSNTKRKAICHAIAEMTGQPYHYIREQFLNILSGKGVI